MEQLFKALDEFLKSKQKEIAEMPKDDAVFALGDLVQEFGDLVNSYAAKLEEAVLSGGDIDDVEVDSEPEYFPDLVRLAESAVIALAIRGDIVGQLESAKFPDHAKAVTDLLSERGVNSGARQIAVKDDRN